MERLHRLKFRMASALLLGALGLGLTGASHAQGKYPDKPVRVVVPYAPGGLPDTVARIVGKALGDKWGQQLVVDNHPGGNGVVAAQYVMSSPADGYTVLLTDNSMFSINPALYPKLPYDLDKNFLPVSLVARAPLYLAVSPSIPANDFKEFIAFIKSNPGKYSYGSSGIGSTHHLCMEAMKSGLGLNVVHVPYKGTGQSVPAVVGGDVAAVFSAGPSVFGFAKSGKVKLLAVNSLKRSPQSPNLPAIAESIPGFDFAPTIGIFAPAGTSAGIVKRISEDVAEVVKLPAVIEQMKTLGIDPVGGGPAEYADLLKEDVERYRKVVKQANVTMD